LIGKFILKTPSLRARESVRKIAARLGVSTNTVLKVSRVPFEAASVAAP
jgi:DNA-binding MurR/RpiR family transcriptional regulator